MAKKMISFEGTEELREILRTVAFYQNKTVSALIRDTLEEALGNTRRSNNIKIGADLTDANGQKQ